MTALRGKPLPTDPYSLPQAYQRWLYEDYAYLWRQQSAATQAAYRSAGVRFHLTGFQYWMKDMLTRLPDIAAWYKLDRYSNGLTYDSSRNQNTATLFGPGAVLGTIGNALHFDGVNDYLLIPPSTTYHFTTAITIEFFFTPHTIPFVGSLMIYRNLPVTLALVCWAATDEMYAHFVINGVGHNLFTINADLVQDTTYHIAITFDGTLWRFLINGAINASTVAFPGTLDPLTTSLYIGRIPGGTGYIHATLDNFIIYYRALDLTEILRHSLRRYPTQ